MTKKILALILAAGMLTSVLSGCTNSGDKDANTSPSTSPSPTSTSTPKAPENAWDPVPSETKKTMNKSGYPISIEPITVTAVFQDGAIYDDPEKMLLWNELEKLTNIKVKWQLLNSQDASSVDLFFASGKYPDFFYDFVNNEKQAKYGVEGRVFTDVSGLIDEYMPNMVGWFEEFPSAKKIITQSNGEIYTMPRIQKASTSAAGQLFYRTDYLEQVGITAMPKTVDEFYTALKAVKDKDLTKGCAPLLPYNTAVGGHLDSQLEPFLFAAFGESVDPLYADDGTGKVVFNRISDQYKKYIEFMAKLYSEGLLEKEMFTLDTATTMSRVKEGKTAFMTHAANLAEADFASGKVELDCLAPLTSEHTSTQKVIAYPYVSSTGGAINAKSKYVEEILRLFDIFYSKEEVKPGTGIDHMSQNLGIKGVTWDYADAEKTSYKILLPEGWAESQWNWLTKNVGWGQKFSAFVFQGTSTLTGNAYAREIGMIKNNIPYAVVPFPDTEMKYTEEESQSIATKMTDIRSYADQMRAKFITGVEPISNWDEYVSKIKEMKIDDVLAIKQGAYNRWNKE